jgi:hypothetical protein
MAETRAIVERLEKTLLGNGQPGWCAEHRRRIARIEQWRAWIAGALALIAVLWMGAVSVIAAAVVQMLRK